MIFFKAKTSLFANMILEKGGNYASHVPSKTHFQN